MSTVPASAPAPPPKQSEVKHVLAVIGEDFKKVLYGGENVTIAELPLEEKYLPGMAVIMKMLLAAQINAQQKYAAVKGETGVKKAADVIGITFEAAVEIAAGFGATITKANYQLANDALVNFQKAFTVPGSLTAAPTTAALIAASDSGAA
jgi:hypothetical protein